MRRSRLILGLWLAATACAEGGAKRIPAGEQRDAPSPTAGSGAGETTTLAGLSAPVAEHIDARYVSGSPERAAAVAVARRAADLAKAIVDNDDAGDAAAAKSAYLSALYCLAA